MRSLALLGALAVLGLFSTVVGLPLSSGDTTCAIDVTTVFVTVYPDSSPAQVTLETTISSVISTTTIAAMTVTIALSGEANPYTSPLSSSNAPDTATRPTSVSQTAPAAGTSTCSDTAGAPSSLIAESGTSPVTASPSTSPSRGPQGFGPFTVLTETFTIPLETSSSSCPESSSIIPTGTPVGAGDTSGAPARPSIVTFTLSDQTQPTHHRVSTVTQGFGGPRKTITIDSTSSSSISMFTASFTLTLSGNVPPLTSPLETESTDQPSLRDSFVTGSPTPVVVTISHLHPTSGTTSSAQPSETVPEGAPSPSIVTYTVPGSRVTNPDSVQGYTDQGGLGSSPATASETASAITFTLHPGVPSSEVSPSVITIDVSPLPTTLPTVPSPTDKESLTQYPTPFPPLSASAEPTPVIVTYTIPVSGGSLSSVAFSSTAITVMPIEVTSPPWPMPSITGSVVTYTIFEGSDFSTSGAVSTSWKPKPFAPSFTLGGDTASGSWSGAAPSEITLWPSPPASSAELPTTATPAASSTDEGPPEITIWPTIPLPPASLTTLTGSVLTLTLPPIPSSLPGGASTSSAFDTSGLSRSNPGISSIWTSPPEISSFVPSALSSTCTTLTPPGGVSSSIGGMSSSTVGLSVVTVSVSEFPTSWTSFTTVGFTTVGDTSSSWSSTSVPPAAISSTTGWLPVSSASAAPTDSTIVITLPSIPAAETSPGGYGLPSEATSALASSTPVATIPEYGTPIPAPSSFHPTSVSTVSITLSPSVGAPSSTVLSGTGLPIPITTLSSPRPLSSGILPPNVTVGTTNNSMSSIPTGNASFTGNPSSQVTASISPTANTTTSSPPFPMNTSTAMTSLTGPGSSLLSNASATAPAASANATLSASALPTASGAGPTPSANMTLTFANGTSPSTALPTGTGVPQVSTSNGTISTALPSSNWTLSSLGAASQTGISSVLPANASISSTSFQGQSGAGPTSTGNSTLPVSSPFLNSTVAPEVSQTGLSTAPINATAMPTPLPSQSGISPNATANLTAVPSTGLSQSGSVATLSANATFSSNQTGVPPSFTGNMTVSSSSFPTQTAVGSPTGVNSGFPTTTFPTQSRLNGTSIFPSQTGQLNTSSNGNLTTLAASSRTASPTPGTNGTLPTPIPANQTAARGGPSTNATLPTTSFPGQTGGAGPVASGNGTSAPFPTQTGSGGANQTNAGPSSPFNATASSTFPSATAPTASQTGFSANSSLPRPNQSGFPPTASLNQTGTPAATSAAGNQTQSEFPGATSTPGSNQTVPGQGGFPPISSSRNATGAGQSQSGGAPLTSSLPTAPSQSAFSPSSSTPLNQTTPNVGGNQTVPGQTVAGPTAPTSPSIPGGSQQGFPPATSSSISNSSSGGLAPTVSQAGGNQSATAPTSTAGANQGVPPALSSTPGVSQSAFPGTPTGPTSSSMSGNWSSTSTVPSPSPTCGNPGDTGDFTLSFDDLPPRNFTNGTGGGLPFISPYHRFWFTPGFTLLPPPVAPYEPTSPGKLVQYRQAMFPNGTVNRVCQIGIGDERSSPCMRFTMLSFNLGCNSTGAICQFNITGQQNPGDSNIPDTTVVWNVYNVTACPAQANCSLTPVVVDSTKYTNLSAITIQLSVDGDLSRTWWGDDLRLSWTNNTCDMAKCRATVPNTVGLTKRYARSRNQGSLWKRMLHAN